MENRRLILIALIGVIVYLLYQNWQTDYGQTASTVVAAAQANSSENATATTAADRIVVRTDKFVAEISTAGADLHRVELLDYPLHKNQPDYKLPLLDDHNGHWSILQSGLASSERSFTQADTVFAAAQKEFVLREGSDVLEVPLSYHDASGYQVNKTYRFHRNSYVIDLIQSLHNEGGEPMQASAYIRWQRKPVRSGDEPPFAKSFLGFGVYEQESANEPFKFKKLAFSDLDKASFTKAQTGGWIVMLQHYFVAGIVPPADESLTLTAKPSPTITGSYNGQYVGAFKNIAAGATQDFSARLFIGPTLHGTLDSVAPGFDLTEDYGWLTPVAKPLFWIMKTYHNVSGNWGAAIILLTVTVRLLLLPLTAAQFRSSAKMRQFAPRMKELRDRYADNREQLNRAMMELYKKEGFNPLAGCWPLLFQFPVFIAMYWVVSQSVELRQAAFMLWIDDLTAADPYFVLPVLYGATMWLMQKISGQTATMDPMQARVMNIMPIMMTGMFALFPSGLVLYWVVSNTLSILQQWLILRRYNKDEDKN
jgi:YidC/Oxa1 family membrane protein insertase